MTLYFHSWQYLVRGWLYRDIIFSPLTIFGEGVIISWHHIFTSDNIGEGVIISWHYTFTPGNIWWGGDCIVTLYFHSWQYLVRGWLYRDIIFSLLTIYTTGTPIFAWTCVDSLLPSDTTSYLVNIGSGNGLLCDGTKPLPEPMLANHQEDLVAFTWRQFQRKYSRILSLKWVWTLP